MKKQIVALALSAMMLLLSGCEAGDADILIDIAKSWAVEHAIDIGKYTFLGSSGNVEVDAVMEAKDVVTNIMAADQLMEEGRQGNDLTKMEQAIKKRPGDYTYRVSYGAALLKGGNADAAQTQFQVATDAAEDYGGEHAQTNAIQTIDELGALGPEFEKNGFANKAQCQAYYGPLAASYDVRFKGTQEAYFKSQSVHFAAQRDGCN